MNEFVGTWGLYPWFPTDDESLVMAADRARFRLLLPYGRVFQCIGQEQGFITIRYGEEAFRVKPNLFKNVASPAFSFGEKVRLAKRPEVVGVVRDILWHHTQNAEMYFLEVGGKKKPSRYFADELSI